MSRIGKLPIVLPAGVTAEINGQTVTVKGPKGELKREFSSHIDIEEENGSLLCKRHSDAPQERALHGLTRALLHNMVVGVSEGFQKKLNLVGVGYRAAMNGSKLALTVGKSHPVEMDPGADLKVEVPSPPSSSFPVSIRKRSALLPPMCGKSARLNPIRAKASNTLMKSSSVKPVRPAPRNNERVIFWPAPGVARPGRRPDGEYSSNYELPRYRGKGYNLYPRQKGRLTCTNGLIAKQSAPKSITASAKISAAPANARVLRFIAATSISTLS